MMLTKDDNDDDNETKMELLNNALATIAAHVTVPYTLHLDDEEYQQWLDKSEEFLEDHSEGYHDLAFNLGTLQALLMSPTTTTTTNRNWLEQARDHCDDDDEDDLAMIEHNIMWAKQFWQTTTMLDETPDYSDIVSNNNNKKKKNDALSLVAKINQSLLLSDANGKLSSLLPSHPNPKWNPLQVRMYWYNRAIGQLKLSDQLVECQESCQSLKRICSSSSGGGGGDGKKNNNKKKDTKKKATTSADLWWEARADVLLAHVQDKQGKTEQAIERLEQRLASLQQQNPKNRSSFVVDHAIAHVSLHLFTIQQQQQQQQQQNKKPAAAASDTIDVLKSLPSSIQSMPAVQATLEALGGNDGDNSNKKKKTKSPIEEADIYFAQGNMEQAAKLYTTHLLLPKHKVVSGSNSSSSSSSLDETQLAQHLRCVQALAMIGRHDESVQLWDSLQQQQQDESIFTSNTRMNGEALEQQALPRSSTTTTNKTMMLGTNNNNNDASQKSSQRRSHDAILRQRARKRQAYLKDLTIKGQYNPDRSTPLPNPERWIPKHARNNNNRRRGQRGQHRGNNNRSAQGGGSQADAQRLDAAARRAGTVPTLSGPSTANMKVADGSRKIGRRR
eukprot:scaffold2364_cov74-Cylindrotheca_fusiformis.AAC.3